MMWTAATGKLDGIIDADSKSSSSVCASLDGKCIVSCHDEGIMRMWQVGWGGLGEIIFGK
jgi:hypothetical protein